MRHFIGMTWLFLAALLGSAQAEERTPVVLELYTSQGCSSCPPADRLLSELAGRSDVFALSLHVDYWDYIGWTDTFADPSNGRRQKSYAENFGERMVYTPQMIVQGRAPVVGHRADEVKRMIAQYGALPPKARLTLDLDGAVLRVQVRPAGPAVGAAELYLFRFEPAAEVAIGRGENAGHHMAYTNVVRDWHVLGAWSGDAVAEMAVPLPGDLPALVVVQRRGQGEVLAAARAR